MISATSRSVVLGTIHEVSSPLCNHTGTNLGTAFSDIVSITVGSLNCIPIEDSWIERRIACDIDSESDTG